MSYKKYTTLSISPRLLVGLCRAFAGAGRRKVISRLARELKVAAGCIPAMALHDMPEMKNITIYTRLKGGAIVTSLAKIIHSKQFFEFGTHLGETAMEIAQNCPDATIVTLDLPDQLSGNFGAAQNSSGLEITDGYLFTDIRGSKIGGPEAARITQLREDSSTFDPLAYRGRFDLIYIDASHSYSAVKSDSEKAFLMLKSGGVIIWDDYCYPGIWQYLNELARGRPELVLRYIYDWDKVVMLPSPAEK